MFHFHSRLQWTFTVHCFTPTCCKHTLRGLLSVEQQQAEKMGYIISRLSWTPKVDSKRRRGRLTQSSEVSV